MAYTKSDLIIRKNIHRKAVEMGLKKNNPQFELDINNKILQLDSMKEKERMKRQIRIAIAREKIISMSAK